jgi:hypothetical protein
MDMQLGIAITRQVMGEQARDHIARLHRLLGAALLVKAPRLDQIRSTQPKVAFTLASKAASSLSSPPTSAISDTDLGAERPCRGRGDAPALKAW